MDTRDATPYIVALTTVSDETAARRLVRGLIEDRVIACGTILAHGRSIYRWEGEIAEESEVVVLMKTRRDHWPDLQRSVTERHPYDVPELLALPVALGMQAYLDWVTTETGTRREKSS
jgi:periplasmic divalent cation tolerance protein